jgi:flagellar assembly factor FliW
MPTLECPGVGRIDYAEREVLDFPAGLPAFETLRRFVLAQVEQFAPFLILASADSPGVRFVCVPIGLLDPCYRFELTPEEGAAVGLPGTEYCADRPAPLLLAIVTLPGSGAATANLASPVVIDPESRRGVQVILSTGGYSHAAPLAPCEREAAC